MSISGCLPLDLQNVDPMFNFTDQTRSSSTDLDFKLHVDHAFRHAKELMNATHGGYNQGYVDLPAGNSDQIVQLSTIPSSKSEQPLQPNMLHLTIMDAATRKALWKLDLEPHHWRLRFKIRGDQAFLLNLDGTEMGAPVNPLKVVQVEGGARRLLFGEGGILMTIITPLQSASRSSGIRLTDVFDDRINSDDLATNEKKSSAELAAAFTNKKINKFAKIELHRCRIRADVSDAVTGELLASGVSGDINNTKNNDVGAINLLEMSDPRSSCTEGGYKVLLSSEFRAPTLKGKDPPVRVLYVIEKNGKIYPAEEVYKDFKQISLENFQIYQNSTLAFIVPAQNVNCIRRLQRSGDTLKLALFRPHDGMFSARMFNFDYFEHSGDCHFCAIMGRSGIGAEINSVKQLERKKRARKDERVRRTVHRVSDASSNMFSPPPTVSSSSGVSSQEEFSPASKVQRLSEGEFSPEYQGQTDFMHELPLPVSAACAGFTLATQDDLENMIFQEPANSLENGLTTMTPMNMEGINVAEQVAAVENELFLANEDINSLLDSVVNYQHQDSKPAGQQFGGFDKLVLSSDDGSDYCSSIDDRCLGVRDGCHNGKKDSKFYKIEIGNLNGMSFPKTTIEVVKSKIILAGNKDLSEKEFGGFDKLELSDQDDCLGVSDGSVTPKSEVKNKKTFVDKGTDMEDLCHLMNNAAIEKEPKKSIFRSLAQMLVCGRKRSDMQQ